MINLMQIDLSRFVARFLSFSDIVGGLASYHDQCVNAVHYVLRVIIARERGRVVEEKHVTV